MYKTKLSNKVKSVVIALGLLSSMAVPVQAKVTQQDLANPVVGDHTVIWKRNEEEKYYYVIRGDHKTTYSYVYFGNYPQREIKGEELTQEIINADYGKYGDGVVNGRRIRRLSDDMTTPIINTHHEFSDNGVVYRYYYYEPIKWKIFENEGNTLFLVSDLALDNQNYRDGKTERPRRYWANSGLRRWLNYEGGEVTVTLGTGWYNYKIPGFACYAFSEEEMNRIQITNVESDYSYTAKDKDGNPLWSGPDTKDKIFILNETQIDNLDYGVCRGDGYSEGCEALCIYTTEYARAMNNQGMDYDKADTTWLRSAGKTNEIGFEGVRSIYTMLYDPKKADDVKDGSIANENTGQDGEYVLPALRASYTLDDCIRVSFQTNSNNTIGDQILLGSNYVKEPGMMTSEIAKFVGWYLDEERTKPYLFNEKVTQDTTLYAGWKQNKPNNVRGGVLKIEGTTDAMEYASSDKEDAVWITCQNGATTVPNEGNWYVRYKKTAKLLASDAVGVEVKNLMQYVKDNQIPENVAAVKEEKILTMKGDGDITESTFTSLQARAVKTTKKSVKLKWKSQNIADGYLIYAAPCNTKKKKNTYKLIQTIPSNSSVTYTHKSLKKGTYYKYIVAAYKDIGGQKVYTALSKTIHATTPGGKYGNGKAVKIKTGKGLTYKKGNYTLRIKKNKKYKLRASEVKENKKIQRHRKLAYESDNTGIATVSAKGVIKAKTKGSCNVYVYGQNGRYAMVKITVK